MADLFRVLMRDNRELVPLADEIELCRQYLGLEKLRLSDRLQVEWHLNNMPGDALVPPLVLQPLLENAVYHGIEPSSAPGVVSINIFFKGGDVHAILRNPYQAEGGRHHAGNKMALGQHPRAPQASLRRRGHAGVARPGRRLRSPHPDALPDGEVGVRARRPSRRRRQRAASRTATRRPRGRARTPPRRRCATAGQGVPRG